MQKAKRMLNNSLLSLASSQTFLFQNFFFCISKNNLHKFYV